MRGRSKPRSAARPSFPPNHPRLQSDKLQEESEPEFENYEIRLKALATCLQRLKPTAATMIRLHYEEKRSLAQVGERLQMTVNAVKQSLFRARRNLQQCIEVATTQK